MGDVTAWQNSAGEPQTPGPEGLTFSFVHPHRYRTSDFRFVTAIPNRLSYRTLFPNGMPSRFYYNKELMCVLFWCFLSYCINMRGLGHCAAKAGLWERFSFYSAGGGIPFLKLHNSWLKNSSNTVGASTYHCTVLYTYIVLHYELLLVVVVSN